MTAPDFSLLVGPDFIGVRAPLVKALGGDAVRALVLTRILYRATSQWRESHEVDGQWWWRASYEAIAEECGLGRDQVKRAVLGLEEMGWIVTGKFQIEGRYDRTSSYRLAVAPDDRANTPDEDRANTPDVPLLQKIKTIKTLDGPKTEKDIDGAFGIWWNAVPKKTGKVVARKAYSKALTKATARTLFDGIQAYRRTVIAEGRAQRFILHPATWLNGEHWEDELGPSESIGVQAIRELS